MKEKNRNTAFNELKAKLEETRVLCNDPKSGIEDVEECMDELDLLKEKLNEAQYVYESLLDTAAEREHAYQWYGV